MKKYVSPITSELTPDNWKDLINPADLSLDEALDILGDFKAMMAFAKKLEGYMKQVTRAKMPEDDFNEPEYTGTHFSISVAQRSRVGGLDKDKITEEMGEEWVEEHSKPATEYEVISVKPIAAE